MAGPVAGHPRFLPEDGFLFTNAFFFCGGLVLIRSPIRLFGQDNAGVGILSDWS